MSDEVRSALDAVEAGPSPSAAGSALEILPAGEPSDHPSVAALRDRFGDRVLRSEVVSGDQHVVYLDREGSLEILRWLHDEPSQHYDFLADVTAVDYGGGRPIQVVYQLWSMPHRQALRVKCELPLNALVIQSVVPVWNAANWLEREVYDLFGVTFTGHPDLRRILMPHNYAEGHPLRKDFPLRGRFSRAEQTRRALSQDPDDYYTATELAIGRDPQLAQQPDADASSDHAG